jgi:hypothetical protein
MNLFLHFGYSQTEISGTPLSFSIKNIEYKNGVKLEYIDSKALKEEYEQKTKNDSTPKPLQIGIVRKIGKDFVKECQIIEKDSFVIATYKISSPGAYSMKIAFDKFRLTESARFYLYTSEKNYVYGAFSKHNEGIKDGFAIREMNKDEVILELNCLKREFDQNLINLAYLTHNFEYMATVYPNGRSLPCHNNVNCDRFDPWCNQIRSVALFSYENSCDGLSYSCSGSLVNNYDQDFKPYFLTAKHCTNCLENYPQTIFYFNRQSPTCETRPGVDDYTVNGSEFIESCGGPDIALLKLSEIPFQYNVFFSGWDTRPRDNKYFSYDITTISHPKADLKKISHGGWYNNWYNSMFYNSHWETCWRDGRTEKGSSGGPVFENTTKRIIGVNSFQFNDPNCDEEHCSYMGKLRYCWHDGGIQKFLGKGISTEYIDGAGPIKACLPLINLNGKFRDAREYRAVKHQIVIQGAEKINIGGIKKTTFEDASNFIITAEDEINITGEVDLWTDRSFPQTSGSSQNVELEIYTKPCISVEEECGFNYFKMANAGSNSNSTFVEKEDKNTEITINPNPTTNNSTLTLIGYQDKKVDILVLDQSGKTIFSKTISKVESKEQTAEIESKDWTNGIYIVRIVSNQDTKALKLIKE